MKKTARLLPALVATALIASPLRQASAEDIDLFVTAAQGSAVNPNILVVIDNSANWSRNDQGWPTLKQGQSELRALSQIASELNDKVNFGLMMFTAGTGSNANGGYVRFPVQPMTSSAISSFQTLLGANTSGGIYGNFSTGEQVGTAKTDYGATMFEVFKYFGGWTSPAKANDPNPNGDSPIDTTAGPSATHFGNVRFGGNPDSNTDPSAFTDSFVHYKSPIDTSNACAKNYVIFIGNGFPTSGSEQSLTATALNNVKAVTTQLAQPTYSVTPSGSTVSLGSDAACHTNSQCVTTAQSITAYNGYPVNSWSCTTQASTTSTGCAAGTQKNLLMQAKLTQPADLATGSLSVPTGSNVRLADEWAKFLYTTDVNSAEGRQFVQTYTIDVFKDKPDTDQSALLASMAKYGGGKYFQATTESAILAALRSILIEIQGVNSVFASASLPINATNRSQNENQVFIGMFRPDGQGRPRWYGNLKRYQIGLFGQDAKLADKDGKDAVDAATTGFINSCATSFWTTDSSTYWNLPVDPSIGKCTTASTSVYSDAPDGPLVEKGAAAEVVRLGNDPGGTTTYAVNRNVYTCTSTSISPAGCNFSPNAMHTFDATNISAAELGVLTTQDQTSIIDFTLGKDIGNENLVSVSGDSTSTQDVRTTVHGDVAHSRPLPVNYGGSTGVVLYYGANDGAFRAVRGSDGKELWSFIAPEHHAKLKRLRDNSPQIQYSGATLPGLQPKDYFFDGSAGLYQTFNSDGTANTVWVYPTMRRGGRMLYAFDVSNPATPKMKWRAGCPNLTNNTDCTSSSYGQIGETWSIPNVALVKGYSTSAPLVIVGGGYDSCDDQDTSLVDCSLTKGNRVFVIDAGTGALVQSFTTDRAVPGDVTLVDRDFDGFVDHAYAADTGGNLYRIDFVDPATLAPRATPSTWTITKIAQTNGPADPYGGRKFLFGPAVLATSDKVYLTLTSGDRERPLISNYPYVEQIQNRAYMLIDRFATAGLPVDLDGSTMNNFTSGSTCATVLAASSPDGWFFDLNAGQGEQGVTSSIIFGGLVFFSTNRPLTGSAAACSNNLGEARGYAVNLLNASGAVGTAGLCDGTSRSNVFTGGGLPPSPVTGTVPVGDKMVTVMIGGVDRSGGASSPIGSQKVTPTIAQKRQRIYWYKRGEE